jgi:UDPglucose 6-dehydrogenase
MNMSSLRITVIGIGYVGLVSALCFADKGHEVTCLDINKEKIKLLKRAEPIFHEPGVAELLKQHAKQMMFTTQAKPGLANAEVIFIAVGTPEKSDGSANLQYIYDAAKEIVKYAPANCMVIVKSTVPVGTCDQLNDYFHEHARAKSLRAVSNPEFLAQGSAVRNMMVPERIVLGLDAADDQARDLLKALYIRFTDKIVFTSRRSAELIKYASNNFLAIKISFINEIANLCDIVGANIDEVSYGVGLDSRIGGQFLRAGTGYGGSCFPKDTKALHWLANFHDYEMKTVKAAIEVNENQKLKLIKKARAFYPTFRKLKVAVLGATFKPATDDLRESPALPCLQLLIEEGAQLFVYDPRGLQNLKERFGKSLNYCKTIEKALLDADLCLIFTEWPEITQLPLAKYAKWMRRALVIDGRNCYDPQQAVQTGVEYVSIGRPADLTDTHYCHMI